MITSTTAGEGKSTTAANLAVTLARSGRHVILLDLDLRQPGVDRFFDLDGRPGLTSVAVGEAGLADVLSVVDVHPESAVADTGILEVVKVGPAPPDPGEFLSSAFVSEAVRALAKRCDVLLIDSPPMLAVGDAMAIASRADAVVVVTELNQIRRVTLDRDTPHPRGLPGPQAGVHRHGQQRPLGLRVRLRRPDERAEGRERCLRSGRQPSGRVRRSSGLRPSPPGRRSPSGRGPARSCRSWRPAT